jgi:hypothetical protein
MATQSSIGIQAGMIEETQSMEPSNFKVENGISEGSFSSS